MNVFLNIEKLGGYQNFKLITSTESKKSRYYRYVCSTWIGDGMQNDGAYDILHDKVEQEYVAVEV
jgi:hypothetical protein